MKEQLQWYHNKKLEDNIRVSSYLDDLVVLTPKPKKKEEKGKTKAFFQLYIHREWNAFQ